MPQQALRTSLEMIKRWFWQLKLRGDTIWLNSSSLQSVKKIKLKSQNPMHLPSKTLKISQGDHSISHLEVTILPCIGKMNNSNIEACISNSNNMTNLNK